MFLDLAMPTTVVLTYQRGDDILNEFFGQLVSFINSMKAICKPLNVSQYDVVKLQLWSVITYLVYIIIIIIIIIINNYSPSKGQLTNNISVLILLLLLLLLLRSW